MSVLISYMTSSSGPSTAPVLTNKRILDDTSIAALSLPNGERRLFFQDLSGVIRQAFYSTASRQWRADVNYLVVSDAKNHTPLAVAYPHFATIESKTNVTEAIMGNVSSQSSASFRP